MECSLCGKNFPRLSKAEIEGSIVDVCDKCVKFGTKVFEPPTYKPITKTIDFNELKDNETEFIANYGKVVKQTRELKGLTREDFAKKLNEKESVIQRIEEEQMLPNDDLLTKLESSLGIKLKQEYKEEIKHLEEKKKPKLTVGDVVKVD